MCVCVCVCVCDCPVPIHCLFSYLYIIYYYISSFVSDWIFKSETQSLNFNVVAKVILVPFSFNKTVETGQCWSRGGDNKQCGHFIEDKNDKQNDFPTLYLFNMNTLYLFNMNFLNICMYLKSRNINPS